MVAELDLDDPSGGTARHLVQLLQIGYQVTFPNELATKPFKRCPEGAKVGCDISVKQDCVQFTLFTKSEPTGPIRIVGNW